MSIHLCSRCWLRARRGARYHHSVCKTSDASLSRSCRFPEGETVSVPGKTGVYETVVVIQRQTQRKDPACGWEYGFRLQPSLSKDQNNARARAVQVLGSGGLSLPSEASRGPCDCNRQAKGDGSREHGGQALVTSQVALRTSAFLLPWNRGGATERCSRLI